MENHEEDDLEELRSTVYTFPPSVQSVIEQVRSVMNLLSNCLDDSLSTITARILPRVFALLGSKCEATRNLPSNRQRNSLLILSRDIMFCQT